MSQLLNRVLVVEDAPVMRRYYRQVLEGAGFAVEEAENGAQALEAVAEREFDLCITDINMPVMDGTSFVRTLRRAGPQAALPVLMITVQSGDEDRAQALQAGANAFLAKPVARERLAAYARLMLGRGA